MTSSWRDAVAGMAAGTSAVLVGHPFDTIRVRSQMGTKKSTLSLLRSLLKQDGFLGLWRGMGPPLFSVGIVSTIAFSANSYGNEMISRMWPTGPEAMRLFLAGMFAGTCCSIVSCPSTNLKVRMQTADLRPRRLRPAPPKRQTATPGRPVYDILGHGPPGEHPQRSPASSTQGAPDPPRNSSTVAAARYLWRKHGFRGLYRAYGLHVFTESVGRGVYFTTYPLVKEEVFRIRSRWARDRGDVAPDAPGAVERLIGGATSGVLGWLFIYPLEVVKTRIQAGMYRRLWRAVTESYRTQGIRIFFRGLGLTLLRSMPVAMVTLPVYDLTKSYLESLAVVEPER